MTQIRFKGSSLSRQSPTHLVAWKNSNPYLTKSLDCIKERNPARFEIMQRKSNQDIQWLEFDLLANAKGISHAVLLRHGGTSQGPYASLNVSTTIGDEEGAVQENLSRVETALQLSPVHFLNQVHGTHIVEVKKKSAPFHPANGDALICSIPGAPLLLNHADCQAALIYDPVGHVVAAVHAGWRGNVHNFYKKVVDRLKEMGSNPADLLVGISPSLGPEHAQFINYEHELPKHFWPYQIKPMYFDLWAIAEDQFKEAGVLPHHIEMARICTFTNKDDCFSYRRDKTTGRHGSVIVLNDPT